MSCAGIDGCRGGWLAVVADRDGIEADVVDRFADIPHRWPELTCALVDIPVGLLSEPRPGGRTCDQEARRLLGKRGCTVFSPPSRDTLDARSYDEVRGRGLTLQAFNILDRVREVDEFLTASGQQVFREGHPELAFRRLAGEPLAASKRSARGRERRRRLIGEVWPLLDLDRLRRGLRGKGIRSHDLLDALALLYVARRIANGRWSCLPAEPERDERGLRMEIWH